MLARENLSFEEYGWCVYRRDKRESLVEFVGILINVIPGAVAERKSKIIVGRRWSTGAGTYDGFEIEVSIAGKFTREAEITGISF